MASRIGPIGTLQDYLVRDGVVGISDIDTRALVRHIRKAGAMNCIISSDESKSIEDLKALLAKVPSMDGLSLSQEVCCKTPFEEGDENSALKVAVIDFGIKKNIVRCLTERGAYCKIFPMHATTKEILEWQPNGIMYSNGPGDPSAMPESIQLVKELIDSGIPGFGICLGHQIIGLSQGLKTEKMFNGHRGSIIPLKI